MDEQEHDDRWENDAENVANLIDVFVEVIQFEIRRVRAALPSVEVVPRLTRFHQWSLDGNKNAVRLMGTRFCPYQPAARFFIHMPVTSPTFVITDSYTDNRAVPPSLLDVGHLLEEDCPQADIRHRCEYYGPPFSPDVSMVVAGPRVSTPVIGNIAPMQLTSLFDGKGDVTSFFTATDPQDQTQRIALLEMELVKLREQMASIVQMKENEKKQRCVRPDPDIVSLTRDVGSPPPHTGSGSDSGVDEDEPKQSISIYSLGSGPTAMVPPPPPPPPPPVNALKATPVRFSRQTSKRNIRAQPVTMTDVLKDLHKVKLRHVGGRSPGGTPTRRSHEPSVDDPGAFLEAALRKKFASVNVESPTTSEKENQADSSWENSPEISSPYARKPRRRSQLMSLN